MRVEDGHPSSTQLEREFAGFAYLDCARQMSDLLREAGVEVDARWSSTTTYYLEVKGTLGHCDEPLFVSQNQADLVSLDHVRRGIRSSYRPLIVPDSMLS